MYSIYARKCSSLLDYIKHVTKTAIGDGLDSACIGLVLEGLKQQTLLDGLDLDL
jgi:hypothetical protein